MMLIDITFIVMGIASLTMDIYFVRARPVLKACLLPMLRSSYAILGSRIVLNLRGAITTTEDSSVDFATRHGSITFNINR